MQLVILAAGRGKRMKALTDTMPKPMLSILGNNLIEHKLSILPKEIDEIIIVVGYLGEIIKSHFGDQFGRFKIKYAEQSEALGTMMALKTAEKLITGRFMVMMGDDLYSKEDVEACLQFPQAILVKKVEENGRGSRVIVDKDQYITEIIEGTELDKGMYTNAGMYVLSQDIFKYPLVQIPSGEFGLPQTLIKAGKDSKVSIVESRNWHQISSPEDLERVEKVFVSENNIKEKTFF